MKVRSLQESLVRHGEKHVRFMLPEGRLIPAGFHLTEVSHVRVKSIDCGGTVRSREACLLQLWVPATDRSHRLSAEKFAGILERAGKVIPSRDLEVQIEYEAPVISQYTVESIETDRDEIRFGLGWKHTDCLARGICEAGATTSEGGCAKGGASAKGSQG